MDNKDFYDELSVDYDTMVNPQKLIPARMEQLKGFIKAGNGTALDAGCGSGIDSIALSQIGFRVTAVDQSPEMIRLAQKNAGLYKADISFINSDLNNLPENLMNSFDVVISLGNTISNIDSGGVNNFFSTVSSYLNLGGVFIFQILNYNKLVRNNDRIVNITGKEDDLFIRFNDFHNDGSIKFNILKISKSDFTKHKLITTDIFNYTIETLQTKLHSVGFNSFEVYGGLNRIAFDETKSPDIVMLAYK